MATVKEHNFFSDSLSTFRGEFLTDSSGNLYFEGSPTKWHNSGFQIGGKTIRLDFNAFTHLNFSIRLFSNTPLYDPIFSFYYWPSMESNKLKLSSYCNLEDLYSGNYIDISVPLEDIYNGTEFDIMNIENFYFKPTTTEYKFQINFMSLFDENFVEVFYGPNIKINLNELNFGTIPEQDYIDVFFDISNIGDQPLENITMNLTDNFTVDVNNFSLEPLNSKTVKVSFNKSDVVQTPVMDPLFESLFQMFENAKLDSNSKLKLKEQLKMFIDKL